jgi:hypothetical protein
MQCLMVMPMVLLAAALPISIGGWGTRELAIIYMVGLFGVSAEQGLILSVEFGLLNMLASLPGALIWVLTAPNTVFRPARE